MAGLREKKKEAVRKNILDAAANVFYTYGYEQATMAEIAQQANTGVGTCYNYFPSKANLFCECVLFAREDQWEEELGRILEKGFDDPADIVLELIYFLMEAIRPIEKPLLREFLFGISEMFMQQSEEVYNFFQTFIERRYQVIEAIKEKNMLPLDMDTAETMTCIFSIAIVQIVTYAVKEDMTMEEFFASLRSKIQLFFLDKSRVNQIPSARIQQIN